MATDSYAALTAALRERLAVIADRDAYARDASAHMARLQEISERIATLQGQLPPGTDSKLAHYLERCSYDKALAFLENR